MSRFSGVIRKSSIAVATLTVLAAMAGPVLTAPPAAASVTARVAPASCGSGNFWVSLEDGTFTLYLCSVTTKSLAGSDLYSILNIHVRNRVWLHQNPNNSGWADCFETKGGEWGLHGRDTNPGNIQVVSNTAPCLG
jgi:hypothetical protein